MCRSLSSHRHNPIGDGIVMMLIAVIRHRLLVTVTVTNHRLLKNGPALNVVR